MTIARTCEDIVVLDVEADILGAAHFGLQARVRLDIENVAGMKARDYVT
jgi:hypothetical protein